MQRDRREILAMGELVVFLAAWMLGIFAAVSDYRGRAHSTAGSNVAATSSIPEARNVLE